MAPMNKFSSGNHVLDESGRANVACAGFDDKEIHHSKASKENHGICNDPNNVFLGSTRLREELNKSFAEYLPADVVDELCKLVQEKSHGNCSCCCPSMEKIVLSVLKILLRASQRVQEMNKEKVSVVSFVPNPGVDGNDNPAPPSQKDNHISIFREFPKYCTQHVNNHTNENLESNKCAPRGINGCSGEPKNVVATAPLMMSSRSKKLNASREVSDAFVGNSMKRPLVVLDTPIVMHEGNRQADFPLLILGSPEVEVLGHKNFTERCVELGNKVDDLYNQRNVNTTSALKVIDLTRGNQFDATGPRAGVTCYGARNVGISGQKHITSRERFPITTEERAYYNILCGLAHSQWSCFKAVDFGKTTVTYSSLGESVEPKGLVDNFFIAGVCCKLFADQHPRQSKKHFFYPNVGGCLYNYSNPYDVKTVEHCFVGANFAYKLHLSHKLCFPIWQSEHWFVFIVDLDNKLFVFLDSLFGVHDNYQINARTKLVNAFRECWYQHAEVKLDVDSFQVAYPPVPKQQNAYDCGIFALKFMELCDNEVDLRQLFDQSDIPNIRVKLGVDLFFSQGNCMDKSLVIDFYEQGIDPRTCN